MTTRLVDESMPISGEIQFWRLDPRVWERVLDAVRDLGIRHVATYLSWRRHQPTPGATDFGSPRLDVRRFLDLCGERRIGVHLKPGPWICAEEPGGGLPDWILGQRDLLALDHAGAIVVGYNPPFRHPVPSYASQRFRGLAAEWYAAVWDVVGGYAEPGGVIEAWQLDNEPSVAFQDAMYRCDYSPAALAQFRRFVLARHGSQAAVAQRWGLPIDDEAQIVPPRPVPAGVSDPPGPRERDWIAFHEHYIGDYLAFLHRTVVALGGGHLTATVNLNTHPVRGLPQNGTMIVEALRAGDARTSVVVGEDHYFEPPLDEDDLAQLELGAALGIRSGTDLVWAPELQAGIWRSPGEEVNYPDPVDDELAAWWGLCVAFGYQGFNLYMLADRENWQNAPLGHDGRTNPAAAALADLMGALGSVTDLRSYRPVPAANLVWDRGVLERAYAAAGTQSQPVELWTTEAATAEWRQTLRIARALTVADVPYALCADPTELVANLPTYGPDHLPGRWSEVGVDRAEDLGPAPVRADAEGVATRLLANADGKQLVVVAAWRRGRAATTTVGLRRHGGWAGDLVDVASGTRFPRAADVVPVQLPPLGVRVLVVS